MVLIGKNIFLILTLQASVVLSNEEGQSEAKKFLEEYNIEMPVMLNKYQNTKWNFRTNLTAENEAVFVSDLKIFASILLVFSTISLGGVREVGD